MYHPQLSKNITRITSSRFGRFSSKFTLDTRYKFDYSTWKIIKERLISESIFFSLLRSFRFFFINQKINFSFHLLRHIYFSEQLFFNIFYNRTRISYQYMNIFFSTTFQHTHGSSKQPELKQFSEISLFIPNQLVPTEIVNKLLFQFLIRISIKILHHRTPL